jgi:hypothetical protein
MKEKLLKKKEDLAKSLEKFEKDLAFANEQIILHRGAIQYNEMLLKELEESEKAE